MTLYKTHDKILDNIDIAVKLRLKSDILNRISTSVSLNELDESCTSESIKTFINDCSYEQLLKIKEYANLIGWDLLVLDIIRSIKTV